MWPSSSSSSSSSSREVAEEKPFPLLELPEDGYPDSIIPYLDLKSAIHLLISSKSVVQRCREGALKALFDLSSYRFESPILATIPNRQYDQSNYGFRDNPFEVVKNLIMHPQELTTFGADENFFKLEVLDLSLCKNILYHPLINLLERCPELKSLNLSECKLLTKDNTDALTEAYPNLQIHHPSETIDPSDVDHVAFATRSSNKRILNPTAAQRAPKRITTRSRISLAVNPNLTANVSPATSNDDPGLSPPRPQRLGANFDLAD
jgi:hypothetical protein